MSIPDFHATIYAALGIDPAKALYDGPRPVPITDGGRADSRAVLKPLLGIELGKAAEILGDQEYGPGMRFGHPNLNH